MKNILITGGASFIGSSLSLQLIKKGYLVTVLDCLHPQIHGGHPEQASPLYLSIKDKVQFIKGDVTNKADWYKALNNQQIVVHLAAETGAGQSMYEIARYTNVNVGGTSILLDYLTNEKHQIEKVIVASSRAVYGEGRYFSQKMQTYFYPKDRKDEDLQNGIFELRNPEEVTEFLQVVATDEESKIQPKSIYGLTKYHQEQSLMICCSSLNIPCVAFRYQNVYGTWAIVKQSIHRYFIHLFYENKTTKIYQYFEDGEESRDFVFIDDVVNATIAGIEKEAANFNVFNVGTGVATTVLTVATTLMKNYGIEVPLEISGQYRKGDIRHNFAETTRLQTILNFAPAVDFETGLRLFCNWVNEQKIHADQYEHSLAEMREKGLLK